MPTDETTNFLKAIEEVVPLTSTAKEKIEDIYKAVAKEPSILCQRYPLEGPLNWTPEEPKEAGLYMVCDPYKPALLGIVRVVFGPRGGKVPWRWVEPVRRHYYHKKGHQFARLTGPEWGNMLPNLALFRKE